VVINNWITHQANQVNSHVSANIPTEVQIETKLPAEKLNRVAIRKVHMDPSREYLESIFYVDDQEVASFKEKFSNGKIYDIQGEIPNGKVRFYDSFHNTYGDEYYRMGKRHGLVKSYFQNGDLNIDSYYRQGELLTRVEYYSDEAVRMEENYEDSWEDKVNNETGSGKVYFQDGTLKYEWSYVNSEKVGYNKSYNRDGKLVAELCYDQSGQRIIKNEVGGL